MSLSAAPQQGFGRRSTRHSAVPASGRVKPQNVGPGTFEFRYTPHLTWAGVLILAPVVDGTMGFSKDWSSVVGSSWEQMLFSLVPWMLAALGIFWMVAGLRGTLALKVAPEGVSATTLYGPAFHKWEDLGRMTVNKKPGFIGNQILSLFGVDTNTLSTEVTLYPTMRLSTWFRTPIEVRVDNTDANLEQILEAIAQYRPDLVERPSWM